MPITWQLGPGSWMAIIVAVLLMLPLVLKPLVQLLRTIRLFLRRSERSLVDRIDTYLKGFKQRRLRQIASLGQNWLERQIETDLLRLEKQLAKAPVEAAEMNGEVQQLVQKIEAQYDAFAVGDQDIPEWTRAIQGLTELEEAHAGNSAIMALLGELKHVIRQEQEKSRRQASRRQKRQQRGMQLLLPYWRRLMTVNHRVSEHLQRLKDYSSRLNDNLLWYRDFQNKREQATRRMLAQNWSQLGTSLIIIVVMLVTSWVGFRLVSQPIAMLMAVDVRTEVDGIAQWLSLLWVILPMFFGLLAMEIAGVTRIFSGLQALAPSVRRILLPILLFCLFLMIVSYATVVVLADNTDLKINAIQMSLVDGTWVQQALPVDVTVRLVQVLLAVVALIIPVTLAFAGVAVEYFWLGLRVILPDLWLLGVWLLIQLFRLLSWIFWTAAYVIERTLVIVATPTQKLYLQFKPKTTLEEQK